jgi:hypothetical protein
MHYVCATACVDGGATGEISRTRRGRWRHANRQWPESSPSGTAPRSSHATSIAALLRPGWPGSPCTAFARPVPLCWARYGAGLFRACARRWNASQPGCKARWRQAQGHAPEGSGGRYWDRTSDLLGVNEAHPGQCRSMAVASGLERSFRVDAGRLGCCTPPLYGSASLDA